MSSQLPTDEQDFNSLPAQGAERRTSGTRRRISAFIVCCNEESKIDRCLNSVSWCDEIVLVDSGSTDKTIEVAQKYSPKIFTRPWPGYVAQKAFGLEQCTSEWVLNLDADEEVSPELRDEIHELLARDDGSINGWYVNRVVFFLGKWWRKGTWYPEYRLRLCRRSKTTWGGRDPHEKAIVEGNTKKLSGELRHYTYANITHQVQTLNNYALQAARAMNASGKKPSIAKIFLHPPIRFIKSYLFKRGYREGLPGLIVAVLESGYVFLKYVKLWEINRPTHNEPNPK